MRLIRYLFYVCLKKKKKQLYNINIIIYEQRVVFEVKLICVFNIYNIQHILCVRIFNVFSMCIKSLTHN